MTLLSAAITNVAIPTTEEIEPLEAVTAQPVRVSISHEHMVSCTYLTNAKDAVQGCCARITAYFPRYLSCCGKEIPCCGTDDYPSEARETIRPYLARLNKHSRKAKQAAQDGIAGLAHSARDRIGFFQSDFQPSAHYISHQVDESSDDESIYDPEENTNKKQLSSNEEDGNDTKSLKSQASDLTKQTDEKPAEENKAENADDKNPQAQAEQKDGQAEPKDEANAENTAETTTETTTTVASVTTPIKSKLPTPKGLVFDVRKFDIPLAANSPFMQGRKKDSGKYQAWATSGLGLPFLLLFDKTDSISVLKVSDLDDEMRKDLEQGIEKHCDEYDCTEDALVVLQAQAAADQSGTYLAAEAECDIGIVELIIHQSLLENRCSLIFPEVEAAPATAEVETKVAEKEAEAVEGETEVKKTEEGESKGAETLVTDPTVPAQSEQQSGESQ